MVYKQVVRRKHYERRGVYCIDFYPFNPTTMQFRSVIFCALMAGFLTINQAGFAQSVLKAPGVKTGKNLALSAADSPNHTIALKLLKAAGLLDEATAKGPYTVFAPTDAAFSALPSGMLDEMLLPSAKQQLIQFLAYHVVKGHLTSNQLTEGQLLKNLTGQVLMVHKQGSEMTIEDGRGTVANVIQGDIRATNGVVYSIDKVLQKIVE